MVICRSANYLGLLGATVRTLPEINIAPENKPLEKEIPNGNPPFLGAMLVLGRVYLYLLFDRGKKLRDINLMQDIVFGDFSIIGASSFAT